MKLRQRIWDLVVAALIIFASILMISDPENGVILAAFIFIVALYVVGLRFLIYYITMARFMVGGKSHLFYGIIILDMGLLMTTIIFQNQIIIVLFLQAFYGISGAIDILRARESKKTGAPIWKSSMLRGVVCLLLVVLAFVYGTILQSEKVVIYIFCAGLLYTAAMRIVSAFRKTAVVYIQ